MKKIIASLLLIASCSMTPAFAAGMHTYKVKVINKSGVGVVILKPMTRLVAQGYSADPSGYLNATALSYCDNKKKYQFDFPGKEKCYTEQSLKEGFIVKPHHAKVFSVNEFGNAGDSVKICVSVADKRMLAGLGAPGPKCHMVEPGPMSDAQKGFVELDITSPDKKSISIDSYIHN